MSTSLGSGLRVLLVGYNGANNTGAEALLLADLEDVRTALGPQAVITIPSINPSNLRRNCSAWQKGARLKKRWVERIASQSHLQC
jgi:hypothetical protein